MIECPSCKHQEFVGTMYCSECGTRLVCVSPVPDRLDLRATGIDREAMATKPAPPEGPELESGAILGPAPGRHRRDPVRCSAATTTPSAARSRARPSSRTSTCRPFDAYEQGVSRIHAEVRLEPDGVYIVDLDSANGTLVNGKALEPQRPALVHHGDIIQLGRLRLQLISRFRSER